MSDTPSLNHPTIDPDLQPTGKCSGQREGIIKDIIRKFCTSFAKGVALTASILITLVLGFASLNTPSDIKYSSLEVLPNQNWIAKPFSKMADTILKITINSPIGIGTGIQKSQVYNMIADLHNLDLKPGALKAIVLAINSPGGSADASDTIMRLLLEAKKMYNIPIFVYIDSECCSGGMMIALCGDSITASSPSIIGSVGVILGTAFNYSQTMQRLGIQAQTLHAGKGKDELNPFRPWGPDEGASYQTLLNSYYKRFTSLVSTYRPKLTEQKLIEIGAQVFDAPKALELGFIDEINDSWTDFLTSVAQKTGCQPQYQLIELVPTLSFSEIVMGHSDVLRKGEIHHSINLPGDLPPDAVGKVLYYRTP